MISRCPSCGAPAPDEARQCGACGWDFVANKKGEKKPEPPKKPAPGAEKPKSSAPPSGGMSLPPARGGSAEVPATGLGMARLPKVEPGAPAAPGTPDENPFALPVARNLGSKPGDSLFSSAPSTAEPKLPEARPKDEAPRKDPGLRKVEPPKIEPPRKIEEPKPAPIDSPKANLGEEEAEETPSAALFLPSSTKEIVVEPDAKRLKPAAAKAAPIDPPKAKPEPLDSPTAKSPPIDSPKAKSAPIYSPKANHTGRQSPVLLAALAGGALGLLSIGVIFVTLRSEPQGAARAPGASPFGKRASGDVSVTPGLEEPPSRAPLDPPKAAQPPSPAPIIESEGPAPTSIPAPALSRTVEPPKPPTVESAPIDSPKVNQSPINPPKPNQERPTATFTQIARPKPAAKPAAAPAAAKKPAGPQWVFEGTVYDLLSTRGVYGVRLVFVDAEDSEVSSVETSEGGRYRASMRAGPEKGYSLRIVHDDYSGKHIDELDSTSSLRKADLEQRKFLMQAGARSLPWIGTVGKPVRRDMALVPKVSAE